MTKILIITPYYSPDLGPSAPMFKALAERLVARGHAVTILAAVPHFPSGQVAPADRRGLWRWDQHNGVRVCRVRVPSGDRSNMLHRLWTFIVYQILATAAGWRLRYEVALVTNPAIETGLPFVVLVWLRRKPCVYAVWDIYPEVGVRAGLFRNSALIKLIGFLEDFCLHRSQRIQVLSDGFRTDLAHHNVPQSKIAVVPHWLETDLISPMPRRNRFSQEQALDGVFVVLYAGNLGLSQGLDVLLETALRLSGRPEILFLIVGDGGGKAQLASDAAGQNNVRFLPYQPRECLAEMLASADISLVTMKRGIGSSCLPSKTFSIMASARPVLACVDEGGDTWNLVLRSQAGLCVSSGDAVALSHAILDLMNDPTQCELMGRNGRAWVEEHNSPRSAAEQFEQLFLSAIEGRI